MKRHLNTLFVVTDGSYLSKEGQAVRVKVEKETKLRVPLINLDGIVCFGRVGASPALLGACAEAGVTVSMMSRHGRLLARVVGFTPGNVLLRRTQYRTADDPDQSASIARNIVAAKIANCRSVLLRSARDSSNSQVKDSLQAAARSMENPLREARHAKTVDTARGYEGEAAATYFRVWNDLLGGKGFVMNGRSRRPPLDPVNALLSFLYSLLSHDARSAAEAAGLDSQVGFLHRDRPGRPSLALDLMEELRPFLADRVALSLINRGQVTPDGFRTSESGAVVMDDDTRKTVLSAYQKRKQDELTHPFLGEKITIGLLVHLQARLLARHLRGDLDEYPPFLWR